MLNVRQLGMLGEPEWRVVFYFSLIASVMSGGTMLVGDVHPITLGNIPVLLGLGITATLAQLALTRAYSTGKTLVVSALSYSTIIFASVFGLLLWNEAIGLQGWLGIALIVGSGMLSLRLSPKH
jgi:drug/metabolite transporter (DMT)-like permease